MKTREPMQPIFGYLSVMVIDDSMCLSGVISFASLKFSKLNR
jgi:hypothetical protein